MASFLISLISGASKQTGLGILDTISGFQYLQVSHCIANHFSQSYFRGVSILGRHIFITTARSIHVFEISRKSCVPYLTHKQEIVHFDWPLTMGRSPYEGLVPILISEKRERIFVGNNSQCSIDELTLNGDFVKRHALWDISPHIFQLQEPCEPKCTYGQTRQLCETETGSIFIIVANCNGTGEGEIVDFDSGESLFDGLHDPRGGYVYEKRFFLQTVQNLPPYSGILQAFAIKNTYSLINRDVGWKTILENDSYESTNVPLQLGGIAVSGNKVYCGASYFGNPFEQKNPNRIVSFDLETGCQKESFPLPDLDSFRHPLVFDMTEIPGNFKITKSEPLTFYFYGKTVIPHPYRSVVEEEDTLAKDVAISEGVKSEQVDLDIVPCSNANILEQVEESSEKRKNDTQIDPAKPKKHQIFTDVSTGKVSISINHVSLCYRRVGSFLFSLNKKKRTAREYWALSDISAVIHEGETVGVIGRNGSGKSSLSMLISGALKPDRGRLITKGKIQLLALGIGFRAQLTGRENAMVSGSILGMPRKKIKSRMAEIEEFSELGEFFDEPISTYSAGMKSRLGFAVSTAVQPDILILDEVMSTGDAAFRNKANKRMEEMRERTKTIVFVSHSSAQIKKICSRVIWLERGRLLMDGGTEEVLAMYGKFCKNPDQWLSDNLDGIGSVSSPQTTG